MIWFETLNQKNKTPKKFRYATCAQLTCVVHRVIDRLINVVDVVDLVAVVEILLMLLRSCWCVCRCCWCVCWCVLRCCWCPSKTGFQKVFLQRFTCSALFATLEKSRCWRNVRVQGSKLALFSTRLLKTLIFDTFQKVVLT